MNHLLERDAFFFVVIEDRGVQAVIEAALHTEGYHRILTFSHATDLLESANTILPAMYVIDDELSGISGFELYKLVQPEGRVIPGILLNAHPLLSKENHPLWLLPTPFTLEEFFTCVKEALTYTSPLPFTPDNGQTHTSPKL